MASPIASPIGFSKTDLIAIKSIVCAERLPASFAMIFFIIDIVSE